jgi:deoxyribonuclease-1
MSWVAWHLKCGKREDCRQHSDAFNRIESDLHNLWPSRAAVNKARRSHPFGIIKGENHVFKGCDFELDEHRRLVEPRPEARGEIARSMFYMASTYGLEIRDRLGNTLKRWNKEDPVSDEERRRNDAIERIQGNRNPYIDAPSLADALRF